MKMWNSNINLLTQGFCPCPDPVGKVTHLIVQQSDCCLRLTLEQVSCAASVTMVIVIPELNPKESCLSHSNGGIKSFNGDFMEHNI